MTMPIILLCGQAGVGKDTVGRILAEKFGFKAIAQADPIKKLAQKHFGFTDETLWGPSDKRNEIHTAFAEGVTHLSLRIAAGLEEETSLVNDVAINLAIEIQKLANMDTQYANFAVLTRVRAFYKQLVEFTEKNNGLSARIVLQLLGTEVGRETSKTIWTNAAFTLAQELIWEGAPGVVITDGRFRSEVLTSKGSFGGSKTVLIKGTTIATNGAQQHASETEILTVPEHFFDAIIENNKDAGVEKLAEGVEALFQFLFPVVTLKSYETVTDVELGATEEQNVEKKEFFYYAERSDIP